MEQIRLLDSGTIDRIAAGEVVERPSSVVKELTENAIDAGADSITVEIKNGGKRLIRVTDNGSGIDAAMVPHAFERHATSKLRRIEDLTGISTLGFRGEALSSIAAVSKVELMTKTADALSGTLYRIEYGSAQAPQQIGLPTGTTVLVKDLFGHVPARQKFLKTDQTEGTYAADLMEEFALSNPGIAFKFIVDGKVKLQTAGSGTLADVIYRIYGSRITKNLIEIDETRDSYHLHGFIGNPALSRGNRRYESVFVNGRYVKDRILQKGIEDGFKRYLMQHQFPFAVLFFETPGNLVDVNVHPAKAQVRFSEEKAVYDFVRESVHDALRSRELVESLSLERRQAGPDVRSRGSFAAGLEEAPSVRERPEPYESALLRTGPQEVPAEEVPVGADLSLNRISDAVLEAGSHPAQDAPSDFLDPVLPDETLEQLSMPIPQTARRRFRLIGSVFDTYWLLEFDGKLYLIDQPAAHERVNYEKFLRIFRSGKADCQQVFPAIPMTLTSQEIDRIEQYLPLIGAYGFEIDHFGGNEYRICGVPTELFGMDAEVFFLSFLDEINDLSTGVIDPDTITDRLAAAACKASIKGNDVISDAEAQHLLELLFACGDPYHCPHGRPTMVSLTKNEIEKMFRRIVS